MHFAERKGNTEQRVDLSFEHVDQLDCMCALARLVRAAEELRSSLGLHNEVFLSRQLPWLPSGCASIAGE